MPPSPHLCVIWVGGLATASRVAVGSRWLTGDWVVLILQLPKLLGGSFLWYKHLVSKGVRQQNVCFASSLNDTPIYLFSVAAYPIQCHGEPIAVATVVIQGTPKGGGTNPSQHKLARFSNSSRPPPILDRSAQRERHDDTWRTLVRKVWGGNCATMPPFNSAVIC